MTQAPISVIIVVRNGERYIAEAIGSVLAQTQPADEILVVDGRSSDNTVGIARTMPGVRVLPQPGKGLADARNAGLRASRGALIAFLDHDDIWVPEKLAIQRRVLPRHPHAMAALAHVKFFADQPDQLSVEQKRQIDAPPKPGPTPGALLAHRSLFDQVGDFDGRYAIGCDFDWFQRARARGVDIVTCPEVLLHKRLHRNNLSGQVGQHRREVFDILRRSLGRRDSRDLAG